MKTYCELYFKGNPVALKQFIDEIQAYANGDWKAQVIQDMGTSWIAYDY